MAWYDEIANTTKGNVEGLVNALRNPQDAIVNQFKQGALYKNKDALASLLRGDTAPIMNSLNAKYPVDPNEAVNVGMAFNPIMAGTFVGKGANTWDALSHNKALNMAKQGIDERDIWANTGNFKGADGHWRQEISDHNASVNKSALPQSIINGQRVEDWKVSDALNHPSLYKAYPSVANIESSFQNKSGASYTPLMDWISYSDRMKNPLLSIDQKQAVAESKGLFDALHATPEYKSYENATTNALDLNPNISDAEFNAIHHAHNGDYLNQESTRLFNQYQKVKDNNMAYPMGGNALGNDMGMEAKPVTLHEIQHAIQHREGFSNGGTPEEMGTWLQQNNPNEYMRLVKSGTLTDPSTNFNLYQRLGGEAEARATEARMDLTPAERLAKFPFDSYDVPRSNLLIK